jgi:RNA polymerase sigma-70 factor, ECF subfamily
MDHPHAHETRLERIVLMAFEEHRRRLTRFFGRGDTPCEDLLQETLLRAWDHRRSLDGVEPATDEELRERARRFVWRIARNLAIDHLRWRRRRRRVEGEPAPVASDAAERVEWEDCVRVVRETVTKLTNPRVRRCVALWLDGGDPDGIARRLGLGPGQVRGLLQRGRAEVVRRVAARLDAGSAPRTPVRNPRTRRRVDTAGERAV